MICDLCGGPFDATPENPGTTTVGGMRETDAALALHLCHVCVQAFHALPPDAQYTQASAIQATRQASAR